VRINDSIETDGLTVNGTVTIGTGSGVTTILDEDNMSSNSDSALATQQSIKSYVDTQVSGIESGVSAGFAIAMSIAL
jgi:hypothetical protein